MPYSPGIQDISGQLRAQGMMQGSQALARGMGDFGQSVIEGARAYQQNKMMTSQALGKFEAIAQQDPGILQFLESEQAPTETSKIYQKMKKDGSLGVKDAAQLAVFADTYSNQKKQAAEDELRKQQAAVLMQQIAMQKEAMAQKQRDQQALFNSLSQFAPKAPQSAMGSAIQGGASFEQLPSRDTVIPGQPAQSVDVPSLVREYARQGGSLEGADKIDSLVKLMGPGKAQPFEVVKSDETLPDGREVTVSRDKTGKLIGVVSRTPGPVLSPEEQLKVEEGKMNLTNADKRLNAHLQAGDEANASRAQIGIIKEALKDPGLYVGPAGDWVNLAKRFGSNLGMEVRGIDSYEKLNSAVGGQVLERIKVLRPASDTDIKILQNYFNSPNKTKEGNEAIADVLDRAEEYKQKRADLIRTLKDSGMTVTKIDSEVSKWERKNPLVLIDPSDREKILGTSGSTKKSKTAEELFKELQAEKK